jgi:hypothetical protein
VDSIGELFRSFRGEKEPVYNRNIVLSFAWKHAQDWIAPSLPTNTEQQPNVNNYLNYGSLTVPQVTSQESPPPNSVAPSEIDMHIEAIRNYVATIQDEINGQEN